jgi:hypothetical protein
MKKRKDLLEKIGTKTIFTDKTRKISIEGNKWFFEIGKELTTDIAEAVSLLLRECDSNDQVWGVELKNINTEDITPEKSLYWLTGGYKEWKSLENYNRPWCESYIYFQEEFGLTIVNIVKRSETLGDIRQYFIDNLNLPVLYDFALSKDLVR